MKKFIPKLLFLLSCALFVSSSVFAQKQEVTGVVKDASGPIVGATVLIDGTTIGTSTNIDGEFTINATSTQTLVVSYLGYVTQEIPVGSRTSFDITLAEDSEVIEDVVVVGYGTMRRSDVSGAVASVKPDELLSSPSGTASDMLRGRATGVVVTSSTARPGEGASILIRGSRSLSSSDAPLYVIDGVASSSGEFSHMNSNDIASIEILKDAAAQAVYGARAANGVILVTTRRGESGKARVAFDSYVSLNKINQLGDFWTPEQLFELRRQAIANDRVSNMEDAEAMKEQLTIDEIFTDPIWRSQYLKGEIADWQNIMVKDFAVTQSYSVSVSQAYEKIKFAISAGYFNQDGIAKYDSSYKRGNFRANVDYNLNKHISLGFTSSYQRYSRERENTTFDDYIYQSYWSRPYYDDGTLATYVGATDTSPLMYALQNDRVITSERLRISPYVEIKPWDFLTYRLGGSMYTSGSEDAQYLRHNEENGTGGSGSIDTSENFDYVIENILTFVAPIKNKDHALSITGVQSYDRSSSSSLGISAEDVAVDYDKGWNMLGDGTMTSIGRGFTESLLISFMGRLQYTLKDRYILTAAIRRDGSSRFGANTKWGTFPSVSTAWRISEEKFMENAEDVSNLKLRLSYGAVGNQNGVGAYETLGTANDYASEFGDDLVMGYLPGSTLNNPNLKWETSATANLGVDFGFFNNRLTGTVEVYNTNTTDLIVNQSISSTTGYTKITSNLGETRTRGLEISLGGNVIETKDFTWNASVNYSRSGNEIICINGEKDEFGNYVDDSANKWFIGESINVFYNYISDGIYQLDEFDYVDGGYVLKNTIDSDGDGVADSALEYQDMTYVRPGYIKLKDLNGDGKITSDDRGVIDADSDYVMSFASTFTYKGFDLFMDWYYSHGGVMDNDQIYEINYGGSLNGEKNGFYRDYWTVDNPTNKWPAPCNDWQIGQKSALGFQDKTFLRLRSLSLGYNFSKQALSKINIQKARVYVSATNLFTKSDVLGFSPEFNSRNYPETRQVVFGVNLEL